MTCQIEFEDPNNKMQGEGCSKKLKVDSEFVKYLSTLRRNIQEKSTTPVKGDDRPWHIELTKRSDKDFLVQRSREIQGKIVDVRDLNNYAIMNKKAFVFNTPEVTGYGPTHVTIAFFSNGVPEWIFDILHV